jgi:hypothetical protein
MSSARYILPYLKQAWNFSANFIKISNTKFNVNPSGGIRDHKCGVKKKSNATSVEEDTFVEI